MCEQNQCRTKIHMLVSWVSRLIGFLPCYFLIYLFNYIENFFMKWCYKYKCSLNGNLMAISCHFCIVWLFLDLNRTVSEWYFFTVHVSIFNYLCDFWTTVSSQPLIFSFFRTAVLKFFDLKASTVLPHWKFAKATRVQPH